MRFHWTVAVVVMVAVAACSESTAPEPALMSAQGTRAHLMQQIEGPQSCPWGYDMGWDGKCREADWNQGGSGTSFDGVADGAVYGSGAGGAANWPALYGVPESVWYDLTPGERELLYFDQPPKWANRIDQMIAIRDFAINESQRLSGQTQRDGSKQNAFQHALWAGRMAEAFGYEDARKWTDAHEERPRAITESIEFYNESKRMDLHNNQIGLGWAFVFLGDPARNLSEYVANRQAQFMCMVSTESAGGCP